MASSTSERFGPYRLIRPIAEGGMARVDLAEDARGRTVALKRILHSQAHRRDFHSMFDEEVRISAALKHPNLVRVYDAGDVHGEPYLAMEYVAGQPLARAIDRARENGVRLPETLACQIAVQMCRGLAHAHALKGDDGAPLGLVHRDISPQNVLLGYGGEVKLVDFGVAKAYAQPSPSREHTRTGFVKGKYLYFSPEQARSRPLDGRTDVFATGVVLYEMLCGRLPYDGDMMGVLFRVVYGEFSRPTTWRQELTQELEAIVLLAMATERERRFPSAKLFGDALESFLQLRGGEANSDVVGPAVRALFADELQEMDLDVGPRADLSRWPRAAKPQDAQVEVVTAPGQADTRAAVTAPGRARNLPKDKATRAAVDDVPELEAPRLVVGEQEFACVRTILSIGRGRDGDIWINDPGLDVLHARLLFEGGAWRVQAAGEGVVRVNGARVRDSRLSPGDRLQLGNIEARFLDASWDAEEPVTEAPRRTARREPPPKAKLPGVLILAGAIVLAAIVALVLAIAH
ncbi:MAG: protein kinase [Deltaproteobacteria bacterium]|nr:protein kinase [Deltaproteobacteria bacterium]